MKFLLQPTLFFVLVNFNLFAQLVETYDNVTIEMRDGEFIEADVYLPSGPGPFEVILIQTPYNKEAFVNLPMGVGQNVDGQPFAWVIVDWRGFYGSSGAAAGSGNRGEDGFDVCEWIIAQSWHADRIGTWGPSALGKIQYDTAFEHHPNHTCAVPLVAHPHQAYDDYFYGGVLEESRLEQLDALGYGLSPTILANVYYSAVWQFAEATTWTPEEVHIPTLQIGGWYDHNIDKMMTWYEATRASALASVQDEQYLLVGPWVHGGTGSAYVGSSNQGELSYPNAAYESDIMAWDFLNYYLLDTPNGWDLTPQVTYYELGGDTWHTSSSASIEDFTTDILYLDQLNALRPSTGSGSSPFVCDPSNPSPTIGGPTLYSGLEQGPYDQVSLLSRNDVVAFQSDVLSTDVTTKGRITANIFIESDQPDGDVAIRLVDEYPDGRNMLITDGTRRIRFRNGYTQADEAFMTPGQVYGIEITLPFTHYTWKAGHKIKIIVSGNNSERWNVNLQDGGTMYQPGTGNIANMVIHHSSSHPSSINLPGNNPVLNVSEDANEMVSIYPNPSTDFLHLNSQLDADHVEIWSLDGKELLHFDDNFYEMDIRSLSPGYYVVLVETNGSKQSRHFVKK